jgi:flavin reductase (DIM6/NTAB) family NADH-FMN oxidoreductase RutF
METVEKQILFTRGKIKPQEVIMSKVKIGAQPIVYPLPVALIGSHVHSKPNFMTIAFCGVLSSAPPMLSISISSRNYTQNGIRQNMSFSVNIPSIDLVKEADYCGITSGANTDKVKTCRFKVFYGKNPDIPMIEQCPINMECRVVLINTSDKGYLITGQIEETHVSDDCLTEGKPDVDKIRPLAYARGTSPRYYALGEIIADAFSIGKELKS